jgi:hypothetical protein
MASFINSDNGVVSGVAGLKYSADNSGILIIQTNTTNAITIDGSQNVTFAGTVNFAAGAFTNLSYTGTLTGGTGVVNLGSGQFYKDASGNVGIGTASPSTNLDVQVSQNSDTTIRVANVNTGSATRATLLFGNNTNLASAGIYLNSSTNTTSMGGANSFNIYQGLAAPITFQTAAVERVRIDLNGNVGINTNNPTQKLSVTGNVQLIGYGYMSREAGNGNGYVNGFYNSSTGQDNFCFSSNFVRTSTSGGTINSSALGTAEIQLLTYGGGSAISFNTGATNQVPSLKVYIPDTGGLLVNSNSFPAGVGNAGAVYASSSFIPGEGFQCKAGVSGGYTNVFNINWTGSAQLWIDATNVGTINLVSDYRIKRNIETQTTPALERVMALRPVTYQMADYGNLYKASDDIKEGFVAHEVQEVIPSGAEGLKDDENQIQSLRVDAILAVAVKAIQELNAKVEALEAQLAAK